MSSAETMVENLHLGDPSKNEPTENSGTQNLENKMSLKILIKCNFLLKLKIWKIRTSLNMVK